MNLKSSHVKKRLIKAHFQLTPRSLNSYEENACGNETIKSKTPHGISKYSSYSPKAITQIKAQKQIKPTHQAILSLDLYFTIILIPPPIKHLTLIILPSFSIVNLSFSPWLKSEIITYFQGSIIDPRSRKERKNETDKLRAQRSGSQSGSQLKRRSKGTQTKKSGSSF